MADDLHAVLEVARAGFAAQEAEISRAKERRTLAVVTQTATGTGNIGHTFELDRKYRLVFIRCHFTGSQGTAPLVISVDSGAGAVYDTELSTVTQAGTQYDVNFALSAADYAEPLPWTFGADDKIRIDWTNPDPGNITWGLEVGLAVAS